ncbi:MAG: hypothetical protein LIP01_10495 [Tannerellaceae bacterium]|nr:hypothetical protein [Tannerellaceae bacterium]
MLKGFDNETKPLTEYETGVLLPVLISGLQTKRGKMNAVKNSYIVKMLRNKSYVISEARVRKIINHIRTHDLVCGLIATSDGYYIAETRQELQDYIESLRGREWAIREVRQSMERQILRYPSV